jgi:hypothetical protein
LQAADGLQIGSSAELQLQPGMRLKDAVEIVAGAFFNDVCTLLIHLQGMCPLLSLSA